MSTRLQSLEQQVRAALGERVRSVDSAVGELTVLVPAENIGETMLMLRDRAELGFSQLIDLCGVDYSGFAGAR